MGGPRFIEGNRALSMLSVLINTRLMAFNRLEAPDGRRWLEQAGFVLEAFDVEPLSKADWQQLSTTRIHKSFAACSWEELAARNLFFVARKP